LTEIADYLQGAGVGQEVINDLRAYEAKVRRLVDATGWVGTAGSPPEYLTANDVTEMRQARADLMEGGDDAD